MKKYLVALALFATPVFAQTTDPHDPEYLTRLVTVLQTERNQAMDALTVANAKVIGLQADLAKANAKIKELEKPAKK